MLSMIPRLAPWPFERNVVIPTNGRYRQFSFKSNELLEDVRQTFQPLLPAASSTTWVVDNKLNTNTGAVAIQLEKLLFTAEDFTIQMKVNFRALPTGIPVLFGSSNGTFDTNSYCALLWNTNTGAVTFRLRTISGMEEFNLPNALPKASLTTLTDYHVEVGRKNGTLYIFWNGELLGSGVFAGSNADQISTMRKFTIQESQALNGTRWDIAIDKGVCLHTASFTPEPLSYTPEVYSEADADAIRMQLAYRRDASLDEANNRIFVGRSTGTTTHVRNGRQYFGLAASASNCYQGLIDSFGSGDFTIEVSFTYTAISSSGFLVLAEWYSASNDNKNNRWYLGVDGNGNAVFRINRSSAGADGVSVTSAVTLTAGLEYRLIAERVAGVVTLYVLDAMSAVVLSTTKVTADFPMLDSQPRTVSNWAAGETGFSATGQLWDVRIADKAMYKGKVSLLTVLPMFPERKYTLAEEADVVSQASFRRSPRDEKVGVVLSPAVLVNGGMMTTASSGNYTFGTAPEAFSAGDFTIEARVSATSTSGDPVALIGQEGSPAGGRWRFLITAGKLSFSFKSSDNVQRVLLDTENIEAGREYYLVVERVGSTLTFYVDGVAKDSGTYAGNFLDSTVPVQRSASGSGIITVRDFRISKTAQYNGVIPKFPRHKHLNAAKPSITAGFVQGQAGGIYGYLENANYSIPSGVLPAQHGLSIGSCTHKEFRFNKNGAWIIRRLKGLFLERSYVLLGFEDTTLPAPDDLPTWTSTFQIDGTTFVYTNQAPSSFSTTTGGTSYYWSGNAPLGTLREGRQFAFEFK